MLKITIELLPYGKEEGKKVLHEMSIVNNGEGTPDSGSYNFKPSFHESWNINIVTNYPRKTSTAMKLLSDCLQKYYDGAA
jgi:hypothetical protein